MPEVPQGRSDTERRGALSAAQQGVLSRLGLRSGRDRAGGPVKYFREVPGLALDVDVIDLMDLLEDPEVLDVFEDVAYPPVLLDRVPLVGANGGTFAGYSGQGQAVAILDTGVDNNYAFLAGKVVSEACYSSNIPASGVSSLCPGGVTPSTAPNSALNCSTSVDGCFHGTHVAGIAAGKGSSFSGVARDARVIAIQVFSDPTKPAIDTLSAAGIGTVIASGNDGYSNAVSAPGLYLYRGDRGQHDQVGQRLLLLE